MGLADSLLMEQIVDANAAPEWRELFGTQAADPRLRDIEVILRAFAMADDSEHYRPSMVRFLNRYADQSRNMAPANVASRVQEFRGFLHQVSQLDRAPFLISDRFSVPIFEAVYAAYCQTLRAKQTPRLDNPTLARLKDDEDFKAATETHTSDTKNITSRVDVANRYLTGQK